MNDPRLNAYDCVYQGWAIIAFGKTNEDTITQLPGAFPYIVAIFDSKEYAIHIAQAMKESGMHKYGKNYVFVVQGVPVNAKWPIIGLGDEVALDGLLGKANHDEIVI